MLPITHASGSETDQLRAMLRPGRLYVIDRGYLDHELYRQIIEADSSFIGRIKDNGSYTTESQCPLPRPIVRQASPVTSG